MDIYKFFSKLNPFSTTRRKKIRHKKHNNFTKNHKFSHNKSKRNYKRKMRGG